MVTYGSLVQDIGTAGFKVNHTTLKRRLNPSPCASAGGNETEQACCCGTKSTSAVWYGCSTITSFFNTRRRNRAYADKFERDAMQVQRVASGVRLLKASL